MKERLCIGCVWTCADCGDDLCEDHVIDLKDTEEPTRYSVYVCHPCNARRNERKAA
jgi:DNA-directed RNA polymerase subunit RPC12/RpoP